MSISAPRTRPMMFKTSVKIYMNSPENARIVFKLDRREKQCAMNQSGKNSVITIRPALGYTSSITPVITLSVPEISEITGPKPV